MLAGPSSSGKTTFSKRLSVQLMACGRNRCRFARQLFRGPRERTPLDETGDYDFEHIEALNLPLFNDQMNRLLVGEEVEFAALRFSHGQERALRAAASG